MRTLVLITILVLPFGNGALGLKAEQEIEAPGSPAEIWAIAGDFCAIKAWHPLVSDCKQANEGETILRTLTAKNGTSDACLFGEWRPFRRLPSRGG